MKGTIRWNTTGAVEAMRKEAKRIRAKEQGERLRAKLIAQGVLREATHGTVPAKA